ncbi:MAG: DEAD/DEAH box helicase, partial [Erysipelotrichaceae bacterium]
MNKTLNTKKIIEAYYTGVVDKTFPSISEYQPSLVFNDFNKGHNILSTIEKELKKSKEFWFSVAFITKDGIICLKNILKELEDTGVKGKILTTDYLGFNDPLALKELLEYKNIEVKVYEGDFHIKGYFFKKEDSISFMLGSSNLTQNALKLNKEWNIKLSSLDNGKFIYETLNEFNEMWNSEKAIELSKEWIKDYSLTYKEVRAFNRIQREKVSNIQKLVPNKMQVEALDAIDELRRKGQRRGMVISSTGTGKTYLSAFDARNFKPRKFLFVVHREQILKQAEKSYKKVFGNNIKTGFYVGSKRDFDADFLFATVQSLSREDNLKSFEKDYFDMIVYDEIHRSGSATYERIINYFKPKFMLGMSATPERTDGRDIYSLFDNNIAYEIRLQGALEEDLLCPFHYFGITDLEIDGETIDDRSDFNMLVDELRVDYIIEKIKYYGHSGDSVHGLVFCSRKEEAYKLAQMFCERGYKAVGLTGEDSQETRNKMVERLEKSKDDPNHLDYIFTVDIFNEGIDIPCVNQIVMIRSTQSSIIFTQQLGRGLRKADNKDYVVVLDFIGNYENNYLIPIALMGDRSFNKDNLRRAIFNGSSIIPGCSTVHFDKISTKRILESIDRENFSELRKIMTAYNDLKLMLGKIPTLRDFYKFGSIDVMRIIERSDFGSYYNFLVKREEDYKVRISKVASNMLAFVDSKLMYGKRIHELLLLKTLIEGKSFNEFEEILYIKYKKKLSKNHKENILLVLRNKFVTSVNLINKYKHAIFIDENFNISESFKQELKDDKFNKLISASIEEGIRRYESEYFYLYKDTDFTLNKKYTYEDVCRLLNWDTNQVALNIGGYKYDEKTNTFPVFINYDKEDEIQDSIDYHDRFISNSSLMWMTKSNRTINSP